jgi:hypothetical protein
MSFSVKFSLGVLGIMMGVMTVFAADMLMNNGRMIAHSLHARTPECSGSCHG